MPSLSQIPKFHSKDFYVLVGSMLPMSLLLNYFLFGSDYFLDRGHFGWATLVTFIFLGLAFLTYGFVAISLRNRFPRDRQSMKRLTFCISIFFLMSAVYISLLLTAYDNFRFYNYQYTDRDFIRCYVSIIVLNVFLTFLNEGLYRFEKYRETIRETEQLKKEYIHSQLLGLKSQMNPHFLFNSLNTLSSLIQEDADKAEDFLDHMSKVYRYLLKNHEEQLVTVETELDFLRSYYFLLHARHSEGLQLSIDVDPSLLDLMIPPMTLQMVLENSLSQNSMSRKEPLKIFIRNRHEQLEVCNNIQPRINQGEDMQEALDNIANKYRLLCQQSITIEVNGKERSICLPLIANQEMSAV